MLADGIEVEGAELNDGLLYVDLIRPLAEERVRSINIKTGKKSGKILETTAVSRPANKK